MWQRHTDKHTNREDSYLNYNFLFLYTNYNYGLYQEELLFKLSKDITLYVFCIVETIHADHGF